MTFYVICLKLLTINLLLPIKLIIPITIQEHLLKDKVSYLIKNEKDLLNLNYKKNGSIRTPISSI
jgi:hypothetical protein